MGLPNLVNPNRQRNQGATGPAAGPKSLPQIQIDSQEVFLQNLRRERRRTERSGRPFVLVLLNSRDLVGGTNEMQTHAAAAAIAASIRETDTLGWYQHPTTLGILMTEVGDASPEVVESIVRKISVALQGTISPEAYCRLTLTVRIYPNDSTDRVFSMDPTKRTLGTHVDSAAKRAIDVAGSLLAILLLAPVFLTIAILIKCTSTGPILFRKKRLGQFGKEFSFFKFRTMYVNNDPDIHKEYVAKLIAGAAEAANNGGLYKIANDPRVTPLGRFLRRTSLDELPQFFNVLLNDMSLVGPRPPLPYEYERYNSWHKRRVLELKPGITGLWQVEGRSRTTFDEMVRMDIRYATTRSFWVDLVIMVRTPAAMISGRGAC